MSQTPCINLVVLRSRNLEKLKDFYEALLQTRFEHHTDHGPKHYGARLNTVYLELYHTSSLQQPIDSVGLYVGNLENAIARVGKDHLHNAPTLSPYGRSAILRDPDNRLIHLTESVNQVVQHRHD